MTSPICLNHEGAIDAINKGHIISRFDWGKCKIVRSARDSDADLIPNMSLVGLIVEDCQEKLCDCSISAWVKTQADIEATDYYVVDSPRIPATTIDESAIKSLANRKPADKVKKKETPVKK